MRIVRADIFGFGKWVDKTFHFPEESLMCFYGQNESGKTTLQQFIIYMLFGFPPRKRALFQPKMSSKFGGRLIVSHSTIGEFSIERLDDEVVCYLVDGAEKDEAWLEKQLNGMNEEMYRSIYSFSALDLSDIQEMKDDALGEILFSIGLTGATNIYTVERNIERKTGDLFKPSGRIPKINKQLTLLNRLYKKSAQYEKQEASYRLKKEKQLSKTQRLKDLETTIEKSKQNLYTYEKIRHALPTIQDYHYNNDQLSLLNEQPSFPENGIERLNELKKELIPLQSEFELQQERENEYKETYTQIVNDLHSKKQREIALNLLSEKQAIIEKKQLLNRTEEELHSLEEQIHQTLNDLNVGLTYERIVQLSFPFQIETTWIELSKEDELLQLEKDQLLEEKYILLRKKEKLQEDKEQAMENILPDEQIETLKAKLSADEQRKVQLHEQRQRKEDWEKAKVNRHKHAKTILYGSLSFAVLCMLSGFIFKLPTLYFISSLSIVVGFGQQYMTNRSIKEMENLIVGKPMGHLSSLTDEKRIQTQQLIKEQDMYNNELKLIDQAIQELHIDELKWEERNHLYEQKQVKHNQLIDEQQLQYPFLEDISVIHWLELLEALKKVKTKIETNQKLLEKRDQLSSEIKDFYERITSFYEQVNMNNTNHVSIEMIEEWLQNERDLLREKEQYNKFLQQTKNKQQQIGKELFSYKTAINQLFNIAGVESEEQFYEAANKVKHYQQLTKAKNKCLQQLALTFSHEDKKEIIEQTFNENKVELKIKTLLEKIDQKELQLKKERAELADVEATLKHIETSDEFSEITHQIELEQQTLSELALEWTVLQTATMALDKAKRTYRDKYLNEVMKKTSSYFSLITNQAYDKVFPPQGNEPFLVQSPDYTRYDVKELSQGTVDQLYVSLRLAISEVMSERYNVPFIIDDAFVHFDVQRTKNIIDVLLEIGKNQQVILFTCKEDIRQLIPNMMIKQIDQYESVN